MTEVGHRFPLLVPLPAHGGTFGADSAPTRLARGLVRNRADTLREAADPRAPSHLRRCRHYPGAPLGLSTVRTDGAERSVVAQNLRSHPDERRRRAVAEYIYQMIKARKAHGDKVILDDVTMAFLPGAKIGMVGPNGAGKLSLIHI